jgi:hypothetical protein
MTRGEPLMPDYDERDDSHEMGIFEDYEGCDSGIDTTPDAVWIPIPFIEGTFSPGDVVRFRTDDELVCLHKPGITDNPDYALTVASVRNLGNPDNLCISGHRQMLTMTDGSIYGGWWFHPKLTERQKHLQWCKDRAMAYIEVGDFRGAITSMLSDIKKNAETEKSAGTLVSVLGLDAIMEGTEEAAREFIQGFN